MSSEVEVDPLRRGSVPPAVARSERDADDASAVPRGQPAFLVVALAAHGLLLLALGHPALPRQTQDVGVAAEYRAMLHSCVHLHGSRDDDGHPNKVRALLQGASGLSRYPSLLDRGCGFCVGLARAATAHNTSAGPFFCYLEM